MTASERILLVVIFQWGIRHHYKRRSWTSPKLRLCDAAISLMFFGWSTRGVLCSISGVATSASDCSTQAFMFLTTVWYNFVLHSYRRPNRVTLPLLLNPTGYWWCQSWCLETYEARGRSICTFLPLLQKWRESRCCEWCQCRGYRSCD